MLFSVRSLTFVITTLLSSGLYASDAKQKGVPQVDYDKVMRKAITDSQNLNVDEQLKRVKEFDLSSFKIDKLKSEVGIRVSEEFDFNELAKASDSNVMVPDEIKAGANQLKSASEKKELLDFLGISEDYNRLFVFVSYSMPEDMIKAYAREAIWSGATLVLKGFEEGETFKEFVNNKILNMMSYKGVTATVEFDPRLFDAFDVKYVPSIVMSKENPQNICEASGLKLHGDNVTESCKVRPDDSYVKISGAITIDYALQEFSGVEGFKNYSIDRLASLRENIGMRDDDEQVDVYNFSEELLPHQKKVIFKNLSKFGEVEETEHGMIVKPTLPPQSVGVHFKRHGN